jgi:hypothetical protein
MRATTLPLLLSFLIGVGGFCSAGTASSANCVPLAEAARHIGSAQCVTGTILRIEDGRNGTRFLSFCLEAKACPFVVVVFPADVKKMGDLNQLVGKQIEIKGTIEDYDGHPEIVLHHSKQLGNGAFLLVPPVPTDYDVERAGHNSAGKFKRSKNSKKVAKQGEPSSIEDPGEPQ